MKINTSSSYQETDNNNKKKIINDEQYEKGTSRPSPSTSTNSNNNSNSSSNNNTNNSSSNVSIPKNALNKQQAENSFRSMQDPGISEIKRLANQNYGMSSKDVDRMVALAANEGYFDDPYFAYLCDSTIINIYLHHKSAIDSGQKNLITVWGGADTSYGDNVLERSKSFDSKRMENARKSVYLAVKNLNTDAYGCDGVSDYTRYGGTVIYQSQVYTNYPFRVWKIPDQYK